MPTCGALDCGFAAQISKSHSAMGMPVMPLRWAGPPELGPCTGHAGFALVRLSLEVGVGAFDQDGSLHVLEAEATVCFDQCCQCRSKPPVACLS
eukprot:2515403-Heterocapsa_arctica.AAC.1